MSHDEKPKSPTAATTFIETALGESNLFAAWQKVQENQGGAGVDGETLDAFARDLFAQLSRLKAEVEWGEYRPRPLLRVEIPKPDGRMRQLSIPAVRDRVLQTAVALVLAPILELEFEDVSFAYRPNRSVHRALARLASYRDQGYQWVVDADITTFFDEVDHPLLVRKLRRTLADHSLLPLIELWLAAIVHIPGAQPVLLTKGVPQGSPISPLLANLYLDDLDERLIAAGLKLVRFADDFVILCENRQSAEDALALTQSILRELRLDLHPDKTRIVHFDDGFRFLGVNFLRNLMQPEDPKAAPWLLPRPEHMAEALAELDHVQTTVSGETEPPRQVGRRMPPEPVEADSPDPEWEIVQPETAFIEESPELEPILRTLYVTQPGVRLLKEGERLLVVRQDQVFASVPLHKIDQLVIEENALVSTALLRHCHDERITVHFYGSGGKHAFGLDGRAHRSLSLERAQFQRESQPDFRLMLARAYIDGKIHNQRLILRRFNRRRRQTEIEIAEHQMAGMQAKLSIATSLDAVRGCEGQAARIYFSALRRLLPEWVRFEARNRNPPRDPVNVLLSYGYALLLRTMETFIVRRQLNPYLGALHESRPGFPAVACDLMEEFRPLVVDSLVLDLVLNGSMRAEDFVWEENAAMPCRLVDEARRRFIERFEAKLRMALKHPAAPYRMDYQRAIQYQVWHYARVIEGKDSAYDPVKLR